MAQNFKHDCNRCGAKSAAFQIVSSSHHPHSEYFWYTFALCGVCIKPSMFLLDTNNSSNPPTSTTERFDQDKILEVLPDQATMREIAALPKNVAHPYTEAESAFNHGLYSSAGACYRKAMERAVKIISPDATGMLNKRIRDLEKQNVIPKAMIELLDQVRLYGNVTMHEDEFDPEREDCELAREFSHLFLTYAFALPSMIDEAKSKALH